MDDLKLMEILTRLESQLGRAFDNIKEAKETGIDTRNDVRLIVDNVNKLATDVAILKDNNLDKRVSDLEKMNNKIVGGLIIAQIFLTIVVSIAVKLLFK